MSEDFALGNLTSTKGWVRTSCDLRIWIPCPARFPADLDRDSWAAAMAGGWWEQSGLNHGQGAVATLAHMLRVIHEQGYENVPCHQIWAHYRDMTLPPLPLHIGIWKMSGDREQQLPGLSGATDPDVIRPPAVSAFTTKALGTGLRTMRHKEADGTVVAMLGFAFRSAEFETDVQVTAGTPDLRQLQRATRDIEDFIHGMSVYYNPEPPS
jgi:hypothetical protein